MKKSPMSNSRDAKHRITGSIALCHAWICLAAAVFASLPPGQAGAQTRPKTTTAPAALAAAHDEVTTRYTGAQFLAWRQMEANGRKCRVSSAITFGRHYELNHHRVTVNYTGKGTVELYVAGSRLAKPDGILKKKLRFAAIGSGREKRTVSRYRGESHAWLFLRRSGNVRIESIRHTCWRGKGTLYGHVPGKFAFAGVELPYRLMYPRNYEPRKRYPLVLSVSGSGGVGTDNVRNMEMVILARHLFIRYYHDKELECFSLVPQILPSNAIPGPYWPKGDRGAPTRSYHPDWPAVNENGWYVQATLALIRSLVADRRLGIDLDRVYFTGFSYGGKACWEFLKADREMFAAAMAGGGWPIGRARSEPRGMTLARLKLEVRRYKHVPVLAFAGGDDGMRHGSSAVCREIRAQGGKSTYLEFPGVSHVSSASKGWGNRGNIAWLFEQNRKNNPKPGKDPFPGGIYAKTPKRP